MKQMFAYFSIGIYALRAKENHNSGLIADVLAQTLYKNSCNSP
jgi:hypothetical protein